MQPICIIQPAWCSAAAQATPELIDSLGAQALAAGSASSPVPCATHAAMLQVLAGLARSEACDAEQRPQVIAAASAALQAYTPLVVPKSTATSSGRSWWGGSSSSTSSSAAAPPPLPASKGPTREVALAAALHAVAILFLASDGRAGSLAVLGQPVSSVACASARVD